ncbi:apolipoprotein D-like isoform X1 [Panulirus ornatus]|uniref:apolipoprotein D-like isoform X1 n=1 Tax=Panulirus ornatus TaxID=150431 RepID=UPI003A85BF8F
MMAKSMWLPLATLACFMTSQADAQKLFLGGCPAQEVVQNFDTTRYLGKWYEIEKYFAIFEIGGRCITATYSDKGSGKIGVVNEQIGVIGDKPNSIEAEAQFVDPDSGEAKLFVSFGIDFR